MISPVSVVLIFRFVESQSSPSTDPLLLWLNGGPGCSSLEGFLNELGPLHVSPDGKNLYNNTFAWNREANVLFLEAPAGVGFSYAKDKRLYQTDDDQVASDNYVALQHFFQKFPKFKKNEFYITGESYAGVYVPTLSLRVLNGPANINFKGFAIGNGSLNKKKLTNSLLFFGYYHGLIGNDVWNILGKYCCNGTVSLRSCNFCHSTSSVCNAIINKAYLGVFDSDFNIYNLYADCAALSPRNSRYSMDKQNLLSFLPDSLKSRYGKAIDCINSTNLRYYLNQPKVREALHVPSFVQDYELCSKEVMKHYKKLYPGMESQILQLLESGKLRALIYNGDLDMACNFLGDEWFCDDLGLKVKGSYFKWKYNNQIAGFAKYYDKLTFVTVKGSGHMVPQDKPAQAFYMISRFLKNKKL